MGKFVFILSISFIIIFITKESNVIETKKVYDSLLGVYTEQTSVNWDNLGKYFEEHKKKLERFISRRFR